MVINATVILIVLVFVCPVLGGICFGLGVNHQIDKEK